MVDSFKHSVALTVLAVALVAPGAVEAQEDPEDRVATDVISLVTEHTQLEEDGKPSVDFWWASPNDPKWTKTDEELRRAMQKEGIEFVRPPANKRVSKIYRRPNLSVSNATTFASLMGAQRVLVGSINYARGASVAPLGLVSVRGTATVELTSTNSSNGDRARRYEVERVAFGADVDEALARVRRRTSDALAKLVASRLLQGPGPVGVDSDELLFGLRHATKASVVERTRQFLTGLEEVDAVEVRWASEGLIVLQINPDVRDEADTVEYVRRALAEGTFETFELEPVADPADEKLAEFRVRITRTVDSE